MRETKSAALPAALSIAGGAAPGAKDSIMPRHLRQLNFSHGNGYCVGTPVPQTLFVTSNYTLLVIAHCCDCGVDFQAELPFERLIAACPAGIPRTALPPTLITAGDIAFLRALHIDPNLETNENQKDEPTRPHTKRGS
jgi:hypothetical protein